jgi:hypothetical protein
MGRGVDISDIQCLDKTKENYNYGRTYTIKSVV